MSDQPYQTLNSRLIWSSPWYALREDQVRFPDGSEGVYTIIAKRAAVWVLPILSDGRVVLIRNYRYTVGAWLWEIPAGGIEPGTSAEEAARAELAEEIGGEGGRLEQIALFYTMPGISDEAAHIFVARGVVLGEPRHLGAAWGRPRLAMPDKIDPEKAAKQWAIAKAVMTAPPETIVVYGDETRIQLLPVLRAMWHWVGEQLRIPTPGTNVTHTLLGALNIRTGRWDYLIRPRNTAQDFIAFLEHLLTTYPAVPILLIVDNFSSHKAGVVTVWLQAHPRLQVLFLPTYCSHLNPVEPIWLRLKGYLAANRLYRSMSLLLQTTHQFFAAMSPAQALIWAGSES